MLLDLYQAKSMHEEYERRVQAELLVRAALKARAERRKADAQGASQGYRWITRLVTILWRWVVAHRRRSSGQPERVGAFPHNYKL
jgi:hypothetical protein